MYWPKEAFTVQVKAIMSSNRFQMMAGNCDMYLEADIPHFILLYLGGVIFRSEKRR